MPAITLEELLDWNHETAEAWRAHLAAHPELLKQECDAGNAANLQAFAAHIWGVELRWAHRVAGLPDLRPDELPEGPLEALHAVHREAIGIFRDLLGRPASFWQQEQRLDAPWLPEDMRVFTRRKMAAHALLHSQRHWAQMAVLARQGGAPIRHFGDLLLSSALE